MRGISRCWSTQSLALLLRKDLSIKSKPSESFCSDSSIALRLLKVWSINQPRNLIDEEWIERMDKDLVWEWSKENGVTFKTLPFLMIMLLHSSARTSILAQFKANFALLITSFSPGTWLHITLISSINARSKGLLNPDDRTSGETFAKRSL